MTRLVPQLGSRDQGALSWSWSLSVLLLKDYDERRMLHLCCTLLEVRIQADWTPKCYNSVAQEFAEPGTENWIDLEPLSLQAKYKLPRAWIRPGATRPSTECSGLLDFASLRPLAESHLSCRHLLRLCWIIFQGTLLFSLHCGSSTLYPWARSSAFHTIRCRCICLNSPAPQLDVNQWAHRCMAEGVQDAAWLTLNEKDNLESPYYTDVCIAGLSFCCNGSLPSLVKESKNTWESTF